MAEDERTRGLTRRGFLKAAAVAGAAGLAAPVLAAAPEDGKDAPMPRRRLGKTGVDVPILGLGGMFDTVNNQLLLKHAASQGVTYWDTAEAYGNGLSEEGFGRYFTRNPQARKDIFVVTKLTPRGGDFPGRFEKTLARLQSPYVDLFLVHGISSLDEITPAIRDFGAEMKKAGKIRFFGFSSHSNMEACLSAAARLEWIDAIMFSYNFRLMQSPKMREAVAACAAAGVGLVAMKTQGGGPIKPETEAELRVIARFTQRRYTDKQANLKAVWEDERIASICSQMPNLTYLSANVAAAKDKAGLSLDERELLRRYAEASCNGYCAGCSDICGAAMGGAAPVQEVMRCLMYHREYREPELAREVFAAIPEEVRARMADLDYGAAERACPQGLPIAELMRRAQDLLA